MPKRNDEYSYSPNGEIDKDVEIQEIPEIYDHSTWNLSYFRSFPGLLRIVATVFALIAFIVSESTPRCRNGYHCLPTYYLSTYRYFEVIMFLTVVIGIVMTAVNVAVPIRTQFKEITFYLTETIVLSGLTFFLAFAVMFMIGSSGSRITLQIAAVFGTGCVIFKAIHLAYAAFKTRAIWIDGHRPNHRLFSGGGAAAGQATNEEGYSENVDDAVYKDTTTDKVEKPYSRTHEFERQKFKNGDKDGNRGSNCSSSDYEGDNVPFAAEDDDDDNVVETKAFRKLDVHS